MKSASSGLGLCPVLNLEPRTNHRSPLSKAIYIKTGPACIHNEDTALTLTSMLIGHILPFFESAGASQSSMLEEHEMRSYGAARFAFSGEGQHCERMWAIP